MKLPASALLVYALVFCTELGQSMLFPLLPGFADQFALSDARTGAVLAASTLATVAAALPAGVLCARRGARFVCVLAGALIAASAVVQALAPSFEVLLAGRVIFGVAFAAVWTAGTTLVADSAGHRALGISIVVGGLAHLAGPPVAGVLADGFGRALPFALMAGGAAVVTAGLALVPAPDVRDGGGAELRAAARATLHVPVLRSAMLLIALVGTLTGVVGLIVPLLLDREGLSPTEIGGVFALGSVLWVASSLAAVRAGTRAVSAGVAGVGAVLIGIVALMPAFTSAAPFVIGFVVLRALLQAPLSTINYPLGEQGARAAGVATGTVMGLMNLVWGACAAAAPVLTGVMLEVTGAQLVFVTLAALCALAGVAMLRAAPRAPAYA
ncbi:MAG TPA: MFS transporter [Solirubrobacteraceae bacterium]|nr:MFS transporter [Solirubrobacteraceae bacterium]